MKNNILMDCSTDFADFHISIFDPDVHRDYSAVGRPVEIFIIQTTFVLSISSKPPFSPSGRIYLFRVEALGIIYNSKCD